MALNPEVLKWFYEAQQQLKERFDLDTSRKEDMGRIQVVHLFKNTADSEKEPLAFGEPAPDTSIWGQAAFATIKRADNGSDYADPMPENMDDRLQWMVDNQRTFQVTKNEDGSLAMNSEMSDDELMQIYNEAKDGCLVVRQPDGDIRSHNGSGMFLAVDKDGMPAFCDSTIDRLNALSTEQLMGFYENHPELLDMPLTDPAALMQARIEMSELRKLEKPQHFFDRMGLAASALEGSDMMGEDLVEADYQHNVWHQFHKNVVPATFTQYKLTQRVLPSLLDNQNVSDNCFAGEGLEKFFVVDEQGERPLFPDYVDIKKGLQTRDPHAMAEFDRRMADALDSNTLAYCGRDPENPAQYKSFRLQRNEDGNFEAKQISTKKPTLPWYKKMFSIFFRSDIARYQEELASYNNFKSMTDYERFFETMNPANDAQQEKKPLDPEKEALKAKLANMTPEQRFEYDLADNFKRTFLTRCNTAREYLKMRNTTPEEIQQDPNFQEFLQTEKAQDVLARRLSGDKTASTGMLSVDYMKWAAQKAANQQAAAQTGQNVASVQNPQNAPTQNTEGKKPSGPIMGGH